MRNSKPSAHRDPGSWFERRHPIVICWLLTLWLMTGSLAIGDGTGALTLCELETGQKRAIDAHSDWTFSIAFSPDGCMYATDPFAGIIYRITPIPEPIAIETHSGTGEDTVGVSIMVEGDTQEFDFGVMGVKAYEKTYSLNSGCNSSGWLVQHNGH